MPKGYGWMISSKSVVKHRIGIKQYKLDKHMGVDLPDQCTWMVYPTVQKTVVLMLNDGPKRSKRPCFTPVNSSLTCKEALKLSEQLRKAAKASKECPAGEKKRMENVLKDIRKNTKK
ncbi:MAG: hypothetical protein WCI77_07070 [Candidatus Omnitrophota bacterium]